MEWYLPSASGLFALIPLALASAFMPTRTLVTARLMLTQRPVPNAVAFLAGNWVWRVVLGAVVLLALGFDATGIARWAQGSVRTVAGVAALAFAVIAVIEWRLRNRVLTTHAEKWSSRLDGMGPGQVFMATVVVMAMPGAEWLLVAAGCAVIHASGASALVQMVSLVLYTAGQLIMVASPILMTEHALARSQEIRHSADQFRDRVAEKVITRAAGKGFVVFASLSVICAVIALGSLLSGCASPVPKTTQAPDVTTQTTTGDSATVTRLTSAQKRAAIAPDFPAEVPAPMGVYSQVTAQGGAAWGYEVEVDAAAIDLMRWYLEAYGVRSWHSIREGRFDTAEGSGTFVEFRKGDAESSVRVYGDAGTRPARAQVTLGLGVRVLETQ